MAEVKDLIAVLGTGHENAKTNHNLCKILNVSDRKLRELVEKARCQEYPIINRQDGRGYFISDDTDDLWDQYWQMTHRAMAILKSRKHIRKMLRARGVDVA